MPNTNCGLQVRVSTICIQLLSLLRFVQFLRRKRPEMNQITLLKIAVNAKLNAKTEIACLLKVHK